METHCARCGARLLREEGKCPRCLLEGVSEDRLFEKALALDPDGRARLLEEAGRQNPELRAAVESMLQGYAEASAGLDGEEAGAVVGNFRFVQLIGQGGMGAVWEAEQMAPVKRRVALKLIKLGMDTREVVRRFERERQTLALLTHPNIAQVYEAGATMAGRPYFAMELVKGKSLTAWCEQEHLDVEARLKLFLEVCAAVEHAHQKGVIHRDLKPSNILVSGGRVKVIDFGVAKATQGSGDTLFTLQAQILGTPAYMSPEQAESAGADIDTRADVYSLGVTLYELLTESLPIDSSRLSKSGPNEIQKILRFEEPETPSARLSALSIKGKVSPAAALRSAKLEGDLDWVVMKAIRKERGERYASVTAFAEDIRRFLDGEPVLAAPPTFTYRARKFVARHRIAVAAAAAILCTMIAGTSVSVFQAIKANRAERFATLTVADMYARSGLTAGAQGHGANAALWFANAAIVAEKDPERREANLARASSWRRELFPPVRAFSTRFEYIEALLWNPRGDAIIAWNHSKPGSLVLDLQSETVRSVGERAVWHPSGKILALMAEGEVIIQSHPEGKEIARRRFDAVNSFAFCGEEQLAVGCNGSVVWNWKSGETQSLPAETQKVHAVAARDWLMVRWPGFVGICSTNNFGAFAYAPIPARDSDDSIFSGRGDEFFVAAPDGRGEIRRSRDGVLIQQMPAAQEPAGKAVGLSPDGKFAIWGWGSLIFRETGQPAGFPSHKNALGAMAFSPVAPLLASGGYDDSLKLWSLADGKFIGEVGRHHSAVMQLAFSTDGSLLASAQEGIVRVWGMEPPLIQERLLDRPSLAALSPDGKSFLQSGFTHFNGAVEKAQLIDANSGKPIAASISPDGVIMDAAVGSEWAVIAVSTTKDRATVMKQGSLGAGNVQFWNLKTGERLGEPLEMPAEPRGVAIHPSGKLVGVACASSCGVEIDVAARSVKTLFHDGKLHPAEGTLMNGRCAYSPDGKSFLTWGLYQHIHFWDREAGRDLLEPYRHNSNCFDLDFGPSNIVSLAWVSKTNLIEFRDWRTGREVSPPLRQSGWPFLARFNASGDLLLVASRDGSARVWDWRRGVMICPALPHDGEVMGGAFVPGKPWVVTGGHDGAVKFWDYRTGMAMAPPVNLGGWVLELKVTPDARRVIASGYMSGGGMQLLFLDRILPSLGELGLDDTRLLAETEASVVVHPGGDLAPLSAVEWMERWKRFRERQPEFSGHRLKKF